MRRIELNRVSKKFSAAKAPGAKFAVHSISLTIEAREFLVIVGPSGAGKTTLLRLIAGLEMPDAGEIKIEAVPSEPSRGNSGVAMVFQEEALFPDLTARETLALTLKLRGASKTEAAGEIQETAAFLGISDLLDRRPEALSKGERQRVALGRAMLQRAGIFLLDEPVSNLDPLTRAQLRRVIRDAHQRAGTTTVYVTHDQEDALGLADRIVLLKEGALIQTGTPRQLYETPNSLFVATFIGHPPMNLISGTRDNHGVFRAESGLQISLPPMAPVPVECQPVEITPSNRKVIVGIRPEHIQIRTPETGEFQGRISQVEFLGCESRISIESPGGSWLVRDFTSRPFQTGAKVGLVIGSSKMHLFDAATEQRIPT
jgi:ABC-type sugar transport system ATPase subunit